MSISVAAGEGLPPGPRLWAVGSLVLAILLAVLDGSIANVALPTLSRDLGISAAESIWVVNAFQLAVTVSILPLASLGEIWGYKRVYATGLAVFTAASLACALSDSLVTLVIARVFQGLGGAGIMAVNAALVRYIYPRAMIGRGVAVTAMTVAVGSAIGPTVASGILSVADWPWLFAVNVPLGVIAVAVAIKTLPMTPLSGHKFDTVSAILSALTFGCVVTGIDGLANGGGAAFSALELAVAVVSGFLLVRRQLGRPAPLLPIDLLRIPIFALSLCTSICSFTAQMMAFISLPFFFQYVLHLSPVETGLLMTPWPLMTALISPFAGRKADKWPAGIMGAVGLALFGTGLLMVGLLDEGASTLDIVWRMGLAGLGFGIFQSPNNRTLITSAPPSRAGGAGGMLATARLIGQSCGAAFVAVIFAAAAGGHSSLPIVIAAGIAGVAALVSLSRQTVPRPVS